MFETVMNDGIFSKDYCKYIDGLIPETEELSWADRKSSPKEAGIYLIYKDGELVYIGETSNIYDRLTHHENGNGSALKEKIENYTGIEPTSYLMSCTLKTIPIKLGRLEVEKYLISRYNPIYNNYKRKNGSNSNKKNKIFS